MLDIMLDAGGDIEVSDIGDISITRSVRQAVLVRLRWIYGEWRLGPEIGFTWFEDVFNKNPNMVRIKQLIRDEIMKVNGVTAAEVTDASFDTKHRAATFVYVCSVGEETFREEVTLYG